jgi:hypothetical protein
MTVPFCLLVVAVFFNLTAGSGRGFTSDSSKEMCGPCAGC